MGIAALQVLARSLGPAAGPRKAVERVAERGPARTDFEAPFAALQTDAPGARDGWRDLDSQPPGAVFRCALE